MNPKPDQEQAAASHRIWAFIRREPLVHFLALAALLFIANAIFSVDQREAITVDVQTQEYLIQQQQDLLLREMTDEEKTQAIKNFIDDEILVREGRKRGFENSSRIRRLLIQNMRFFITSDIPDPTEEDLRAYFEANIERFETKPSVTYEHVFFSNPETVSENTLDLLRGGADYRSLGDTNPMTARLTKTSEQQIVANFGREQAPRILNINDDQWHGPFTSVNGVHFLRAAERHPGMRPTFETTQNWLRQDWQLNKSRQIVEREMAVMRENYRIEVMTPDSQVE